MERKGAWATRVGVTTQRFPIQAAKNQLPPSPPNRNRHHPCRLRRLHAGRKAERPHTYLHIAAAVRRRRPSLPFIAVTPIPADRAELCTTTPMRCSTICSAMDSDDEDEQMFISLLEEETAATAEDEEHLRILVSLAGMYA